MKAEALIGQLLQKRRGFDYQLLKYADGIALIKADNSARGLDIPPHYEIWILREPTGNFQNKVGLKLPCNEEFGSFGWCYCTIDAAERKFNELTSGGEAYTR